MLNQKIILGNWKSNKTTEEAIRWVKTVGSRIVRIDHLDISLAPQFVHLSILKEEIYRKHYSLTLAAQDVSPFEAGPYTGEIWAKSLAELAKYVLVGHSERRKNFAENNKLVNSKVRICHQYNLIPIVCLSDIVTKEGKIPYNKQLAFNEANFLKEVKTSIKGLTRKEIKKTLLMYEPPSAISKPIGSIGVGEAAPVDEVLKMIKKIRNIVSDAKILYGGSVKSDNVLSFLKKKEIDGVVVGSASLNPEEFFKIIENAGKI